ncbi:MAG: heavy metal-responsive transcriptional regulator [Rhodothermales bacterium]
MKIGEIAKQADVNIDTVRYYEQRGLLPEPPRRPSGYRDYTQDYIARIRFIKRTQELGFSLREIDELLSIKVDLTKIIGTVKRFVEQNIAEVETKIGELQSIKGALQSLSSLCDGGTAPISECSILAALEDESSNDCSET